MARHPELEAILQARYDLETCGPNEKTERRAQLESLLQAALSQAGIRSLS